MPKIPTFEARGRPTEEAGSIKSGIKAPTTGVASALLPSADVVTDFFLKKRNLAEKTESIQIANKVKGEIDKVIHQNKENINEGDAILKLEKSYKSSKDSALSSITNKRIKERVNNLLDIEYSEYVNTIKKNSYEALESKTIEIANNNLQNIVSKHSTTENPFLKIKYIKDGEKVIKDLARDFGFPKNKLDDELKKFNKNILSNNFMQIVRNEENLENISKMDSAYKDVLSNEEFAALSFNVVKNQIETLTIIGDENADFDKAEDLIDEYETLKRDNGFVPSKVLDKEISDLKQKINTESQRHDNIIKGLEDTKEIKKYADNQREAVAREIANPYGDPDYESTTIANEVRDEYNQRFKAFIINNPYVSKDEKKAFAFELGTLLKDKYLDVQFEQLTKFNLQNGNRFNIVREYNNVLNDVDLFSQGAMDLEQRKKYETLAKLNGYVDEKTKKVTDESLAIFFDEYTKILEKRQED